MTAHRGQIPVLVLVDAEPDGFFIRRDRADRWGGLERGFEIMADVRRMLLRRTGNPAHFVWLVRADPQIEEVYGSAAWAFEHYRRQFDALDAAGDEVGIHVHAYRWVDRHGDWIEDYADQDWVAHCVRTGVRAFEATFQRRPEAFSVGLDWTNQATMQLARELGVRWELTPICGMKSQPMKFLTGTYTGIAPDCTLIPRMPYQATRGDFTRPSSPLSDDMWIFPQLSRIAPLDLSWKRRLYERLRRRRSVLRARKFYLTDEPAEMRAAIDSVLRGHASPYLTFAVRTDQFSRRRSVKAIGGNLEQLLERAGANLAFATPENVLRILESSGAASDSAALQSGGG